MECGRGWDRGWRRAGALIVASFFIAVVPYWLLNLFAEGPLAAPWWRIPVGTRGVFDSYVYFNWMGAVAQGLPAGDLLKWYGAVVSGVWAVTAKWMSVPEIWIVTRWLSILLVLAVGPWCLRTWSGLDRLVSRRLTWAFAIAVALSIGLRPGAYSWYLPFALVAVALTSKAWRALETSEPFRAAVWSVAAIALASVYPWYFMFVALWTASLWGVWLARRRAVFFVLLGVATVAIGLAAPWLARWFLDPARAALLGPFERSGIVFARAPFFANTVIAFGAWIVLLGILAFAFRSHERISRRLLRDAWAWMALLLLWFNTPVTGIHLYSDHFIGPTIILALFSVATVLAALREHDAAERLRGLRLFYLALLVAVAVGAGLFVIYIIQQPLRLHPFKFDSYAVHVLHWFMLALAAGVVVSFSRMAHPEGERRICSAFLIGACLIGGWGTLAVVVRDAKTLADLQPRVPVVEWLRTNVAPSERLCGDIESSSFYAAHTGFDVAPAEATLSYAVSNEEVLHMLETIAGAYDVAGAGDLDMFRFETDHYRTIPCASASKFSHNAGWDYILRRLGWGTAEINAWLGCRQDVIDANWSRISSAIERRSLDEAAFRRVCPLVIVTDEKKPYWQLPADYREWWYGNGVGVWKAP